MKTVTEVFQYAIHYFANGYVTNQRRNINYIQHLIVVYTGFGKCGGHFENGGHIGRNIFGPPPRIDQYPKYFI